MFGELLGNNLCAVGFASFENFTVVPYGSLELLTLELPRVIEMANLEFLSDILFWTCIFNSVFLEKI